MIRPAFKIRFHATALLLLMAPALAWAQAWDGPVRGSWVRAGEPQEGDVVLAEPGRPATQVMVLDEAHSAVMQAAVFLATDITRLTGAKAHFNDEPPPAGQVSIRLVTLGDGQELPDGIDREALEGKWEAYQVLTTPETVWLVGSNPRGTAFAVYELAERLGIDPLYHWTGYTPEQNPRLVMTATDHFAGPPTVKYRGMFHDDEDILPRPLDYEGRPVPFGNVSLDWYKRFFETALRLRMNMVAPYTRTHRRFEVQKTASDWGLYYTSHHYDILLSNPYGFERFKLAEKRGVRGGWTWETNPEDMLRYWAGGVQENGALDAVWPVGLRGTDDHPYQFPEGTPLEEQNRIFRDVISAQIEVADKHLPEDKKPAAFHFTLYGEMLDKYLGSGGSFGVPENVILIWPDDNDGRIRALPREPSKWKHGVYYHLAYLWSVVSKQSANMIPPRRIADSFKNIVEAGATEYILVNVSELREYVREARMIADICWDGEATLGDMERRPLPDKPLAHVPVHATEPLPPDIDSPSATRFARWFSAEYFGEAAADDITEAYRIRNDELLNSPEQLWFGSNKVIGAIDSLMKKFAGQEFAPARAQTLPDLVERAKRYDEVFELIERALPKLTPRQQRFLHDNLELPLLMDRRPTQAAILLVQAMSEPDRDKAWALCEQAMKPLEQLELEIQRSEYPPFANWYGKGWIRHEDTSLDPRRPFDTLRLFLASEGRDRLRRPEPAMPREAFLPLILQQQ